MGNKISTEIGNTFLNTLAMPAEMILGQNFYDPTFTSKMGKGFNAAQDVATGVGGALAPMAANALLPGSGQALTAARSLTPDLGKGGSQLEGHNNMQGGYETGAGLGQLGASIAGIMREGGDLYREGGDFLKTGSNLEKFDLPQHEQGGGDYNPNVNIEGKETVDPNAKYVYSEKLINPDTGNSYSKDSEKFKGTDRDDDITARTHKYGLANLRASQESLKKANFEKDAMKFQKKADKFEAKYGGYLKKMREGGYYTPGEAAADGHKLTSQGSQYGGSGAYGGGKTQYEVGGGFRSLAQGDLEEGFIPGINDPNVDNKFMDPSGSSSSGQFNVPGYQAPDLLGVGTQWSPSAQSVGQDTSFTPQLNSAEDPGMIGQAAYDRDYAAAMKNTKEPLNPMSEGFDWSNAVNRVGQAANIGFNLKRGIEPVDQYKSVGNPEYDNAVALAAGRNYDITQAQADARANFDRTRSAISEGSSGEASYLANMQGAQINANKQSQSLYDLQNNKNNQYRMEEARLRTGLGSEEMNRLNKEEEYRLRGEAAREQMMNAATQGISNMAQRDAKENNQSDQDQRLLAMYKSRYGDYGTMKADLEKWEKKNKKNG